MWRGTGPLPPGTRARWRPGSSAGVARTPVASGCGAVWRSLRSPHIVGHSMGGMIAAEMACLAPRDLGKLVLAAPAGLWDDAHPIPDIFALLPFQLAEVLFHDPQRGQGLLTGGADLADIEALKEFYLASQRPLAQAGKIRFPTPNPRVSKRLCGRQARTLRVSAAL